MHNSGILLTMSVDGIETSAIERAETKIKSMIFRCVVLLCCPALSAALHVPTIARSTLCQHRCASIRCSSSSDGDGDQGTGPATKAVWFATEAFGKAAALFRGNDDLDGQPDTRIPPKDLDDSIRRLSVDYEGTEDDPRPYFLTGKMDVALYDPDCEFADPFVSFKGRDRFVENLENLAGGFITESSTRMLSSGTTPGDDAGTPPSYTTKVLVKLRLGLPWSPVLAWPWGVTHVFDPQTGLIIRHIESWDVSPAEGIKQLLSPGGNKQV